MVRQCHGICKRWRSEVITACGLILTFLCPARGTKMGILGSLGDVAGEALPIIHLWGLQLAAGRPLVLFPLSLSPKASSSSVLWAPSPARLILCSEFL